MNTSDKVYLRRTLFAVYIVGLMWILFFIQIPPFGRSSVRFHNVYPQLIPLGSIVSYLTDNRIESLLTNIVGNIILFVPWGFLSPLTFISLENRWKATVLTTILSLTAEVIQYTMQVGVFDVDDILLNTLGGIIGYELQEIWKRHSDSPTKESVK